MTTRFQIFRCYDREEIRVAVNTVLERFADVLPSSRSALILLKPNLNSHMNALAANTTDLRLVASTVLELQRRGYRNIVIGEGTNSGFYRNNISVINRLRIGRLAEVLGVQVLDLNYADSRDVILDREQTASMARICFDAELFINLPKLKTHFEAGITVCMKNLIGCMVSQANKKKIHDNLPRNIIRINQAVKPHLHIIDAMIAMEGNGPTRGEPVRFGRIIAGDNAFGLDYLCSRIMSIPWQDVDYLRMLIEDGILDGEEKTRLDGVDIAGHRRSFAPARSNIIVRTIFNPQLQRYFQAVRRTRLFDYLCSTSLGGKILFKAGIRQDVFTTDELDVVRLHYDPDRCRECGKCAAYCPMGRSLPTGIEEHPETCLSCLYCYLVCPEQAITVDGSLGFLSEQIRQFGDRTKQIS